MNKIIRIWDIWKEPEKINQSKVKKKQKGFISHHRINKIGVHTTIKGRGIVARLIKKHRKEKS